jgi:formylglycine-generating enzyme required for sulfatase activity
MARKAFVWGSNGSKAIGELKYALDDARRTSEILVSDRYGFSVTSPTAPHDPYQTKKELDLLATSCGVEDSFLIYFSGHGELLKGELHLVLDRTIPGDVMTYLPISWVKGARDRSDARNRLIILDCCHAGAASGAKSAIDVVELESETELMLLAGQRLEIAREFDDLKGSFLTTAMVDFLSDSRSRSVGLQQLLNHLNKAAQRRNSKAVSQAFPKVPIPFLSGNQKGEFYFTQPSSTWIQHQIDGPTGSGIKLVVIPAFSGDKAWCVGVTPVTNEQYRRFFDVRSRRGYSCGVERPTGEIFYSIGGKRDWVEGTTVAANDQGWVGPFKPWDHPEFSADDQPVVCVSFHEAYEYAGWLSEQSRSENKFYVTPLEVWDIAAFGKEFPEHDRNEWPQREIRDKRDKTGIPAFVTNAEGRTSLYGAVDMLGNVWEWCGSLPVVRRSAIAITDHDEGGPVEIRGGSYLDDLSQTKPFCSVASIPDQIECRHSDLGFRVSAKVPISSLPPGVAEQVRRGFNLTREVDDQWNSSIGRPEISAPRLGREISAPRRPRS